MILLCSERIDFGEVSGRDGDNGDDGDVIGDVTGDVDPDDGVVIVVFVVVEMMLDFLPRVKNSMDADRSLLIRDIDPFDERIGPTDGS